MSGSKRHNAQTRRGNGQRRMEPYHRPAPTPDYVRPESDGPTLITDPWLIDRILAQGSPMGDAMAISDQAQVARLRGDSPSPATTEQEDSMSNPHEAFARTERTHPGLANPSRVQAAEIIDNPLAPVMQAEHDAFTREVQTAFDTRDATIDRMTVELAKVKAELAELTEYVTALPVGGGKPDVGERVVRFLESHPGTKFSPISIAENLDGMDRVDQICRRLAGAGRISVDNRPGHRPLYFVKG